jgi:hypothetical protein
MSFLFVLQPSVILLKENCVSYTAGDEYVPRASATDLALALSLVSEKLLSAVE